MKLDPKKTALLTLDMQRGILGFVPGSATVIYRSVVLKDACFDADPEVHRVLTDKAFPRQATVLSVDAFVVGQGED